MYQPKEEAYPQYYKPYIQKVLGKDLISQLTSNLKLVSEFFENLPEEKHEFSYASGKWTPKDILQHITDTERVFAYRIFKIARGDGNRLLGFDQDIFVNSAKANNKPLSKILKEYQSVRLNTLLIFESLTSSDLNLVGYIEGKKISTGALGFIILGHELHHLEVIKERYI